MMLLIEAVDSSGAMHLRDAARLLGVSEMTVRRDVAARPDVVSYLGGYILPRPPEDLYVMAREQGAHWAEKSAVCARAAQMIEDDDTIFIDCGTTLPMLARRIPPKLNVTVVCYALNVATVAATNKNIRLIVLGGLYNPSSASFSVEDGVSTLDRLCISKAFISAGGIHAERGVSCFNFHEVAVKRAVIERAVESILVADGSKIGRVKPAHFARLDEFDALITSTVPPELAGDLGGFQGRMVTV